MSFAFENVRAVLLDIEGTICSISFVKDVLFPYALKALPEVVKTKWDDAEFIQYRDQFPEDARSSPEALEEHVKDLTRRDVKVAYLKNLQGYLWQSGYENGSYTTELFDDVLPKLQQWQDKSIDLAIFSSGSVFAQKLLFRHIKTGQASASSASTDHTGLIKDWFDTLNAGSKLEASSYRKIADALGHQPSEVLFLSDNVKEIVAALEADMPAVLVDRPGNATLSKQVTDRFRPATSLDQVSVNDATNGSSDNAEPAAKKTKLSG